MDDETKLTLHGLQQHYVKLEEVGKNRKLNDLLDTLEFNQVGFLASRRVVTCPFTIVGCDLREICCTGDRARQAPRVLQFP